MSSISVYCPNCDDFMEVDHVKGRWFCENCGKDLTKEVNKKVSKNKTKKR